MAISRIKKIELIGLAKDKESLLALLQKLGAVQLIVGEDLGQTTGSVFVSSSEVSLLEIQDALSLLSGFKKESGMLGGMVKPKPQVFQGELKQVLADFDYCSLLIELSNLRNSLRALYQHKERLIQERQLLLPWRKLKLTLEQLFYAGHCGILLGVSSIRDYPYLKEELQEKGVNLFCQPVNQDKANTYLVIFYLQEEFTRLEVILKNHHFNFVTLTRHEDTVADRLLGINSEILILDDEIWELKNKLRALAREHFRLSVIYDHLANIQKIAEAEQHLTRQQFTFSLSGWIKERDVKMLERRLAAEFQEVAIFISGPGEEEEVPVELENNRLVEPFEFITKIYGFPKYSEIDPTPYMAPFFFLYFGFCVSDVGYGIILTLVSWFVLKKFRMGPQGLRFFKLFLFCGISTILVGALTGSWFGNLPDLLAANSKAFLPFKNFKDSLIILDPMKEPTKLLGVALSLGIIQVWFGNVVAAIGNIKNRRYLDVFLDQVPMLTFLFGLTGMALVFLKLLKPLRTPVFQYAALFAAAALILTQGRSEKGWGSRLFYGVYNLYSALSGYLSDTLSYSRLWALGLVTGVMATTINLISVQFSQVFLSVIPFVNRVAFLKIIVSSVILVGIFVTGHLVAFLMNLLGAFVHPVRLQFVEFFSKFFKSGGRPFKPFKVETKYINLSEDISYGAPRAT
jgi:V/A-type H+-transporting ATPase subunit I